MIICVTDVYWCSFMGEIKAFKMTRERFEKLVNKLAADSLNITFINNCTHGDWERAVNYRQMLVCLQKGAVLSDPRWDEESQTHIGNMGRFHAGQDIVLEIAVEKEQHLYVINVCQ